MLRNSISLSADSSHSSASECEIPGRFQGISIVTTRTSQSKWPDLFRQRIELSDDSTDAECETPDLPQESSADEDCIPLTPTRTHLGGAFRKLRARIEKSISAAAQGFIPQIKILRHAWRQLDKIGNHQLLTMTSDELKKLRNLARQHGDLLEEFATIQDLESSTALDAAFAEEPFKAKVGRAVEAAKELEKSLSPYIEAAKALRVQKAMQNVNTTGYESGDLSA